jgi:hypothetical protein
LLAVVATVQAQERPSATDSVEVVLNDTTDSTITLQRVVLSNTDIVIDGHVDEAIWAEQAVLGEFLVVEPDTLVAPAYTTEMKIFYTDRGLYTAFDMEQPPETLVQRHAPRDSFDVNRDTVGLNIDSSGAGRYGYWITLALGDGQMDGTVLPERQYGRDWDGAWYGAQPSERHEVGPLSFSCRGRRWRCRKKMVSAGSISISHARLPISMNVGVGRHCPGRSRGS